MNIEKILRYKIEIHKMTKLVVFQITICSVSFILNLIYIIMKYDISLASNVFATGVIMFNLGFELCKYSLS